MSIRSPRVTDLHGLVQVRTSACASVWSVWRPGARREFEDSPGSRHVLRICDDGSVRQDGVVVAVPGKVGFVIKDHFKASDLVAMGYVPDRLISVFGEPDSDSVDGAPRWDAETVETVERDVLAPAVRVLWDAFAPEWNTRVRMQGVSLPLGWPQMEQMLARVTTWETAERQGAQAS